MLDLSRREAFVSAGAVALAAGVPSWAMAQASGDNTAAAWDLREIYPSDAAWEADRRAIQAEIPQIVAAIPRQARAKRGRAQGRAAGAVRSE